MIEGVWILSKNGLLRFLKIYTPEDKDANYKLLCENIISKIQTSDKTQIIYDFEYWGMKRRIAYRSFGGIYMVLIIDELENELAILDLINVIMKVFDDVFHGVCELDIINNPEKLYLWFDEIISGGIVIETDKKEIVSNYYDKLKEDENYKYFN